MRGVILLEFRRFVEAHFGARLWKQAVLDAGLSAPVFLPSTNRERDRFLKRPFPGL